MQMTKKIVFLKLPFKLLYSKFFSIRWHGKFTKLYKDNLCKKVTVQKGHHETQHVACAIITHDISTLGIRTLCIRTLCIRTLCIRTLCIMKQDITTLGNMTIHIITLDIMTICKMTLCLMTLCKMTLCLMTVQYDTKLDGLTCNTQHNESQREWCIFIVRQSVITMNVVAPFKEWIVV
jgi:hypothetical protein